MTLWPCFLCGSDDLCGHREPELVAWLAGLDQAAAARAVAGIATGRIPPGSATHAVARAPEQREQFPAPQVRRTGC